MRALSLATLFAAASGFIVLWVAAWALGVERADEFQAYWGVFFALAGVIDGVMQETTRAVSSARSSSTDTGTTGTPAGRPWRLGAVVGVVAAVLVVISGFLWMPLLLSESHGSAIGLMAIGVLCYAFQAVLSGVLSGLGLWNQYAGMVALDSGIRLVLAVVAWLAGWGMPVFLLLTVIGALSWAATLAASPTARTAISAKVDVSHRVLIRRVGSAMLATGASAALITGFPPLIKATADESAGTGVVSLAGLMLAVTLTRAPILVPLQRFQSALIVRFVERKDSLYQALAVPLAAVLGLGLVGGAAAWLIGPWIMDTFFDEGFAVPGLILAVLTFASACTGALMITGTATLAVERHSWYVVGWATASLVAFSILALPLPLTTAVCTALIIGPACGALVHLAALRGATRQRGAAVPAPAID